MAWQILGSDAKKGAMRLLPALLVLCLAAGCATKPPEPPEQSVRPGVNKEYLNPELNVTEWIQRFEREGREIYENREAIVAAARVQRGQSIADIGAGTGLFTPLLAEATGPRGRVYAVDIVPKFLDHIERRARAAGIVNVKAVLGTERSVNLPPDSIDLAFLCDVYHHFEFPRSTLTSLRTALRDNGEVFLVDFKRIPGVSSEWTMNHVRAGQEEVTREIEAAGFKKVEELDLLKDNYVLRFRKTRR
jgi:predicted methyltransferase